MNEGRITFTFVFLGRSKRAALHIDGAASAYLQKRSHYATEILYGTIS